MFIKKKFGKSTHLWFNPCYKMRHGHTNIGKLGKYLIIEAKMSDLTPKEMVEMIDDDADGMSDFEIEFIDSMLKQFDRLTFRPTEKQLAMIKKMHSKYC